MATLSLPSTFQSVIGLGTPLGLYRPSTRSKVLGIIGVAFFILLGLFFFTVAMTSKSDKGDGSDLIIFLLFSFVLVILAAITAWRIVSSWNVAVVIYQNGMAYTDGRDTFTFAWNQIASLLSKVVVHRYRGVIKLNTSHEYTITSVQGETIKLNDSISRVEDLFHQVRKHANPHIYDRVRQTLETGQAVQFGRFTVTLQGVAIGKKALRWNEISMVNVDSGTITLKPKKGGLFSNINEPFSRTTNGEVFMMIASQLAG